MFKNFFFSFLLLCFITVSATSSIITLYVGQQKTINVSGAEQISIAGMGKIATGTLIGSGNQIVITGHEPGTVSMTVSYKDNHKEEITIRVLSRQNEQVLLEFKEISSLFNDMKIVSLGDNPGLVGKIYSVKENDYLNAFLERYPEIINLTEDLRGEVLLQMDVQIMEINITGASDLGIEWFSNSKQKVAFPNGLDYGELQTDKNSLRLGEEYIPAGSLSQPQFAIGPIARLSPFTAKINFLVTKGVAKVLARPKLVCKSGEKAEFRVGGEFPIRMATTDQVSIEWKSYGTILEAEPVLVKMGSNEVDVKIKVEISDLDWANQVESFPAISQRIVSTKVKLAEENAVAIAGLLSNRKSRTQSRIPFLGAIPFLGRLFSTTKDQDQEMETVIIITPRILSIKQNNLNIQPKNEELKKELK